ncbi:MAG TPA: 16S rRNA (guanine(966)-N(2))-methyltransferase RsmD [Gammaproteobacteria bacterium]|nr:16S rRNA (guanine(966)-N(2))-methyltransferase RsmD [Gammaproteobacteria bacterium]
MSNPGRGYRNEFRIIGGNWRRRRLPFPPLPGIRPSPDRVRETLFNWLQGWLPGARCLDLFAGSGALGLEALSRGAASCVFVDQERAAIDALRAHVATLQAHGAGLIQADAMVYLSGSAQAFDLVFLDPPFASDLLPRVLARLSTDGWLAPGARVYMECPAGHMPVLPAGWVMLRESRAGNVAYGLAASGTVLPA